MIERRTKAAQSRFAIIMKDVGTYVALRERLLATILVAAGIAERAIWNALRPTPSAAGEALNVAIALASGRGFADAYGPGTGPTAHLLPLSPGLGGLVYAAAGVRSPVAELILACWSIGLAMLTYLLLWSAFAKLGTLPLARLMGLATGCLLPAYIGQEAVDFRLWDGGLTAALMALLVNRLVTAQRPVTKGRIAMIGACCAMLLFVNAPAGVAAVLCTTVFSLRSLQLRQVALLATITVVLFTVVTTPWVMRNYHVFGQFVPSRSNAGLELAVGMDPAAPAASDRLAEFFTNYKHVHPSFAEPRQRMIAIGGEVPYSHLQARTTLSWMRSHPGGTLRLISLHLRQQFAPEPWQFAAFNGGPLPTQPRAAAIGTISLLGLAGLVAALIRRRIGWIYPALLVVALSLLTSPFQPMPRYTYLFYPLLVFAATDLVATLISSTRRDMPTA